MKNKKRKGYVLAFIMILSFAMTILLLQTGNILVRRTVYAKNNFKNNYKSALILEPYSHKILEDTINGWT